MSTLYSDLTNDFPDVASDERYEFREMELDDVSYLSQYETLLNAVKNAATDTELSLAWSNYKAFIETTNYSEHVKPLLITAEKMQTLEDKVISAQRYAKKVQQQAIFSSTQPDSTAQGAGDIWYKVTGKDASGNTSIDMYRKLSDGTYEKYSNMPDLDAENVAVSASGYSSDNVKEALEEAMVAVNSRLSVSGNAASATKLNTNRTIDGVNFNGSAEISHYATCSTAAATAAKTASLTSYSLVTGSRVMVKFTYANTVANPTLNINSTGAKSIKIYGTTAPSKYWVAGDVVEFVYDGTNYIMQPTMGMIGTQVTYSLSGTTLTITTK